MIGRWHSVVLDCPEPLALAGFYRELLGMVLVQDDPDWAVIGDAVDRPGIAFQRSIDFVPPKWPDEAARVHIDVQVTDLDEGEARVLELGARRLPSSHDRFRVFADPVGHPFCLVL